MQAAMKKNHWGVEAVGFKWTEQDSVDNRLQSMDVGRFYSATICQSENRP